MTATERSTFLKTRLSAVRERIARACDRVGRDPSAVTLVAVSKTVDADTVKMLADMGHRDFGENRPQMLWDKAAAVKGVNWHFIGHLQRNKIDRTVPLTTLIHSVDSDRLLKSLNEFGMKRNAPVPILLELNCSREDSKGGLDPQSLPSLVAMLKDLPGVHVRGLMTMAAFHDDPQLCRPAFRELRELKESSGRDWPDLSMGMSNDFEVAIEEGATIVRVGTTLFEGLPTLPLPSAGEGTLIK